jgi:hypothetical protein
MLSKVSKDNVHMFGTPRARKLFETNPKITMVYDDLDRWILYQDLESNTWAWDTLGQTNKHKAKPDKLIQVQIHGIRFIKSLDSFDQSNFSIKNKLRECVIKLLGNTSVNKPQTNFLAIGGESWIYSHFVQAQSYSMISNHLTIVNDAKRSCPYVKSQLVDYNTWVLTNNFNLILINLSNVHSNIINQLANLSNSFKLIIITCHLPDNKLKLLAKKFKIRSIAHFLNISTWVWVIQCVNK